MPQAFSKVKDDFEVINQFLLDRCTIFNNNDNVHALGLSK